MSKVTQVLLSKTLGAAIVTLDNGRLHGLNVNDVDGQGAAEVAKDAANGTIAEYLDSLTELFAALGEDMSEKIDEDARQLKAQAGDWTAIYEAA